MLTLTKWKYPAHYTGEVWPDYFVFANQNRDSDALTRSNFACALKALGGESETVLVVREGHWAVGWVEWIAIHETDADALRIARGLVERCADYPVLDEDHFSELEWSEATDYWCSLSVSERVDLCREAGVSIFSARHDYIPLNDSGYILEECR